MNLGREKIFDDPIIQTGIDITHGEIRNRGLVETVQRSHSNRETVWKEMSRSLSRTGLQSCSHGGGAGEQSRWRHDRHALIRALSWPAHWMTQRGVSISQPRYRQLLEQRLADIALHGDPKRQQTYFPTYLLKCLQDHFAHHGEDLYDDLKHIRNALYGLDIHVTIPIASQRTERRNSSHGPHPPPPHGQNTSPAQITQIIRKTTRTLRITIQPARPSSS